MIDEVLAQARRLHMHVMNGGNVTAMDMSRLVQGMERMQAERDRLRVSGFSAAAEEVRGMAGRIRAMDPVRLEVLATAAALEQAADMLEAKGQEARA